jgi:hypothetical protein
MVYLTKWYSADTLTVLLARPWNRDLLELPDFSKPSDFAKFPDFADDTQSGDDEYWDAPVLDFGQAYIGI